MSTPDPTEHPRAPASAPTPTAPSKSMENSTWYMTATGIISRSSRRIFYETELLRSEAPLCSDVSDFPTYCAPSLEQLLDILPCCVPKCFERLAGGAMKQKRNLYFVVEGYDEYYKNALDRAGKCLIRINDPSGAIYVHTSSRAAREQLASNRGLSLSVFEIAMEEGVDLDKTDIS
ncbi:hypothetical protein B0H13DRAFT_2339670 [Mycena leptocephala]|nr:hypothetical protein B0H13DRAFT_2339670 [Mycena leptocephala]